MSKNKKSKTAIKHPFLMVNRKLQILRRKFEVLSPNQKIRYKPVILSKHHIYPKKRTGGIGIESRMILKIWCYKHLYGWNTLFQFFYKEDGKTIHDELNIDEIITCMITHHPFIMKKIGTKPWKLVFKKKNIEEAIDLLCRMLSMKFNRKHIYILHEKIDIAIPKKIAA